MQESMAHFLEASDPDWLLYDFAPYWLGPIAAKLNISSAFFSIMIAASFRLYEVLRMMDSFMGNDSGVSDLHRLAVSAKGCDVLAVRSCSEFELEWLQVLEEIHES
ncbi:putative UDP-rhamnose:rhamnosyltransferase 1 [Camellia lanceoleosa]|nr:putative UDP-rhamnose:rhamnosyltransferase 1 [Camellia lanceoleosa]